MRLVLDARKFEDFGIGRYVSALLNGLPAWASRRGYELIALARSDQLEMVRRLHVGWQVEALDAEGYSLREQMLIPATLRRLRASLFHAPHYATSIFIPCKYVVTVHDLLHVIHPELVSSLAGRVYARFVLWRVVHGADALIAVSPSTKRTLLQRYRLADSAVVEIANGVTVFRRPLTRHLPPELMNTRFVLFVGNPKPHKNLETLLDAFSRLSDLELHLVIAGGKLPGALAARDNRRVIELGFVSDEQLAALYEKALALVLPSLHEGFGLPALEAMSLGVPVIASTAGALPELVGDAGLLVDPRDAATLSNSMRQLYADGNLHTELSAAGRRRASSFTWEASVRRTSDCYESVLSRNRV